MSVTHFERIQICCEDVYRAASDYSRLLGQNPSWSGQYRLMDSAGRVSDHGTSVWFSLANTRIELCSSSQRAMKPGIVGLVMGCDPERPLAFGDDELLPQRCIYSSVDGGVFEQEQFALASVSSEGFLIALIKHPMHQSRWDNSSDIQRVDHLVLHSHSAEASIERFGEAGLGLRLALDQTVPEWGGRMLFFRCAQLTLEVIVPNKGLRRPDFFWGVAYQCSDILSTQQRLHAAGVTLSAQRTGRKPGTEVCSVKSHDLGLPTLLVQPAVKAEV